MGAHSPKSQAPRRQQPGISGELAFGSQGVIKAIESLQQLLALSQLQVAAARGTVLHGEHHVPRFP